MDLPISWIAEVVQGELSATHSTAVVNSVSHDTREIEPGALFVAIRGERVDGHDLLVQAQAAGAVAVLVERRVLESELLQIIVPDSGKALGLLAKAWLDQLSAIRIALTGSNGKTTVKNLTASILQRMGACFATQGNLNNELGLPLSALSVRPEHRFAVLEMGAGQPGDIDYLADIGRPNIALVNNAMAAHLERLGSILGVAEEKSAVYRHLQTDGTAVINLDDAHCDVFLRHAKENGASILGFALDQHAESGRSADFFVSQLIISDRSNFMLHTPTDLIPIELPLLGLHNVRNALAAAALAFAAGANRAAIKAGLESIEAAPGRLRLLQQSAGWQLLDDAYNANPGSVRAGIDALCALPGEPWLILGNMAELGPDELQLHAEIGRYAAQRGVKQLWCVGAKAATAAAAAPEISRQFADQSSLIDALRKALHSGINVLIKGSRSSRMEHIIAAICDQPTLGAH